MNAAFCGQHAHFIPLIAVRENLSWQPRGWRAWTLGRRIGALAAIVVVGSLAAFTHTLLQTKQPTLATIALVVAMLACIALGWLGIEWYYYPPPRK